MTNKTNPFANVPQNTKTIVQSDNDGNVNVNRFYVTLSWNAKDGIFYQYDRKQQEAAKQDGEDYQAVNFDKHTLTLIAYRECVRVVEKDDNGRVTKANYYKPFTKYADALNHAGFGEANQSFQAIVWVHDKEHEDGGYIALFGATSMTAKQLFLNAENNSYGKNQPVGIVNALKAHIEVGKEKFGKTTDYMFWAFQIINSGDKYVMSLSKGRKANISFPNWSQGFALVPAELTAKLHDYYHAQNIKGWREEWHEAANGKIKESAPTIIEDEVTFDKQEDTQTEAEWASPGYFSI